MRLVAAFVLVLLLPRSTLALTPASSPPNSIRRHSSVMLRAQKEQQTESSSSSASNESAARQKLTLTSLQRQIFCNVELNGAHLEAVGFDMDFTLAQYNEAFDLLAFEGAKRKLIETFKYPKEVIDAIPYSATAFRRGLIIDKLRGNILKVDRHRYVRHAMHGLREMTADERKNTYMQSVHTFTEGHYVQIDTLFLLVDALLFAHLVQVKTDAAATTGVNAEFFAKKSFEQLYRDIRQCVDLCHRDGAIKNAVISDPCKYIIHDEGTVGMLRRLKQAGKKTFLLTNSMWEYTQVVMSYLVYGPRLRPAEPEPEPGKPVGQQQQLQQQQQQQPLRWEDLFDVIIVGANKPSFLSDEFLSLFQVEPSTGALRNVEDKDALQALEMAAASAGATGGGGHLGKIFQGGHWQDLHKMLDVSAGERILYVGDHMYADILRSKRTLGWRTCLIIPELEGEILTSMHEGEAAQEILRMRRLQYDLDEYMDLLRQRIGLGVDAHEQLREAELKSESLKKQVRALGDAFNAKFNLHWGQLFKAGYQESRFAKQVTDYACLYTSRASNLGLVNPNRPFRPVFGSSPHDLAMLDAEFFS